MIEGYDISDEQREALDGAKGPAEQSRAVLMLASQMMMRETQGMRIMGRNGTKVSGAGPWLVEAPPGGAVNAATMTVSILICQGGMPALAYTTMSEAEAWDAVQI